jgi:RNA polymerase sigma-70 factor (ECF subfamily)
MNLNNQHVKSSVCEEYNYNTIFKKHSKDIFNFLMFNYGHKQFAEDALQESFIILWQNCSKVSIKTAKSYLYTVAKNKIIDFFRKDTTAKKHAENQINVTEQQTPSFILEEKEFHKELNEALAKMPEKYRVPFLLNRIEKKKYKEIAEMLDSTVKSIEKRIYNALEFLQKELDINKKRF